MGLKANRAEKRTNCYEGRCGLRCERQGKARAVKIETEPKYK